MKPRSALAAALVFSVAGAASAQAAGRCTSETLQVRGTPVTAAFCIDAMGNAQPGRDLPVQIQERYSAPGGSLSRLRTLAFIAGEADSRVIEDVPLGPLGLQGTLHLTLVLHGGLVRVESAMLTPGAITIK